MRHLWSLLAGIVVAPLAWLFLATGQHRSQAVVAGWDASGQFDTGRLVGPAIFLAAAGLLLGLVGTLRWSPAGPLAAGALFVVPTVLMFNNPFTTLEAFLRPADGAPRRLLGQDLQPWLPVENGTLLVIGALLLVAVFSAQRWRRWPQPAVVAAPARTPRPVPTATDDEVVAGINALSTTKPTTQPSASGPAPSSPAPSSPATATPATSSTAPADPPAAGTDRPALAEMSDDEILAMAAEFERAETRPAQRPADGSPQPAKTDDEGR